MTGNLKNHINNCFINIKQIKYRMNNRKKLLPHYSLLIILFTKLTSCQMKKELPEFHVEMCHHAVQSLLETKNIIKS